MELRHLSIVLLSSATVSACESARGGSDSDTKLVYGRQARPGEFDSTVTFTFGTQICSGVVVSSRHILTAAHCLGGRFPPKSIPAKGEVLEYTNVKRRNFTTTPGRAILVKTFHLHPNSVSVKPGERMQNDLALIETATDIDVAPARVSFEPTAPGKAVWLTGYGCERDSALDPTDDQRLKVGRRLLVDPDMLAGALETAKGKDASLDPSVVKIAVDLIRSSSPSYAFAEADFAFLGVDEKPSAGEEKGAVLCTGDSGGPLYLAGSKEPTVVGINSFFVKKGTSDGKVLYSGFARVDKAAAGDPATWIQSILAKKAKR